MRKAAYILLMIFCISGVSTAENKTITVFTNTIDYATSKSTIDLYKFAGIGVDYVVGSGYKNHMEEKTIFILGGPNAPQDIGKIVSGILKPEEKKYLISSPEAQRIFVVPNLWIENQTVFIFAGYGKEQTRKQVGDSFTDIMRALTLEDPGVLQEYAFERIPVPEIDSNQAFTDVDADQANAIIENMKDIQVIDVRAEPFYNVGHIPGAKNIPSRKADEFLNNMDRDKTYLLYCGGNSESIFVGYEMAALGYKNVYRLVDGYVAWRRAGYPRDRVLRNN